MLLGLVQRARVQNHLARSSTKEEWGWKHGFAPSGEEDDSRVTGSELRGGVPEKVQCSGILPQSEPPNTGGGVDTSDRSGDLRAKL